MAATEKLRMDIEALKIATQNIDRASDRRKSQLAYLEEHGRILERELSAQQQSITQFDNLSFTQSIALGRSRLTGPLGNSRLSSARGLNQSRFKSSALPTVEKQQLEELRKRAQQLSRSYNQKAAHIDDPILRRLEENTKKETAQLEATMKDYLTLFKKEQQLKMMKEALSHNLPLLSRKKDTVPADFEKESINKTVVRRGYTTKMMSLTNKAESAL